MSLTSKDLYRKLLQFQWLINRKQTQTTKTNGPLADTTRGQGRVIATLKVQEELSTKGLAFILRISVPSLNELLSKLEKGEYISRTPSESDRRVMIIRLTDKGKQVKQNSMDYDDIFKSLNDEEKMAFAASLSKLVTSLESDLGTASDDDQNAFLNKSSDPLSAEQFDEFLEARKNKPDQSKK